MIQDQKRHLILVLLCVGLGTFGCATTGKSSRVPVAQSQADETLSDADNSESDSSKSSVFTSSYVSEMERIQKETHEENVRDLDMRNKMEETDECWRLYTESYKVIVDDLIKAGLLLEDLPAPTLARIKDLFDLKSGSKQCDVNPGQLKDIRMVAPQARYQMRAILLDKFFLEDKFERAASRLKAAAGLLGDKTRKVLQARIDDAGKKLKEQHFSVANDLLNAAILQLKEAQQELQW